VRYRRSARPIRDPSDSEPRSSSKSASRPERVSRGTKSSNPACSSGESGAGTRSTTTTRASRVAWAGGQAEDFFVSLPDNFDALHREGEQTPKIMTVALHCRLAGKPARAAAFARFVDHSCATTGSGSADATRSPSIGGASTQPGTATPSLNLEDTSPPWSADAAFRLERTTTSGVRRDKAALSSGCKPYPAIRSSRK
jgi:hypothetical protein